MPKTSARLLALLSLLQTRRDWSGTLLADRLEISLRTVRRDVDRLRELGYPIAAIKGPDGGYRLRAGTELPPLLFDDDQAVALSIALQVAATTPGNGTAEAAERALNTIRQVIPTRLRHRINTLQVTAIERPTTRAPTPVAGDVLLAISAAVQAQEVLRFDYAGQAAEGQVAEVPAVGGRAAEEQPREGRTAAGSTASGQTAVAPNADRPPRQVEPHHLVLRDGRWYLVAWDLDRADWRIFRADRITLRTPNGPRFTQREVPGGDVATYVTGKFRGSDDGAASPCQGVVILDRAAATVALYTRDGVVEAMGADRCRLTLGSWSWPSLAAALGGFDADIEVIGPPELTAAFAHLARRFARAAAPSPE